ncbi:MAG: hypothetical protein AABX82_06795 [Nanoarchaeota archaeon]
MGEYNTNARKSNLGDLFIYFVTGLGVFAIILIILKLLGIF